MILRQKIRKLKVAALYGSRLHDKEPRELLLKWTDSSTFPEIEFSQDSKFELVETVLEGWMDGRGEKHLVRHVLSQVIYSFRGSLSKAFDLEDRAFEIVE